MASGYPDALDTLSNPDSGDLLISPDHAGQHTDANDAIEAVQATLGVNPEGDYDTVVERLDRRLPTVSAVAPSDPETDDVWIDVTDYGSPVLKVFNGVDWEGGS